MLLKSDADPVDKVRSFLEDNGYEGQIMTTEDTIFTVDDASRAVGAPPEHILKSLVLLVDGEPVLALLSGANRVDTKKIKKSMSAKKVRMADPEFVFNYSGFRIGGVPPVGYPSKPKAFLDEDLFLYEEVWAAAGTDHAFFPVSAPELQRLTAGEKMNIKKG